LTQAENDELTKLITTDTWLPLQGPQSVAFDSEADITGYGGAAGGGKTDLACGLALTKHKKSIIYRREGTQLLGILERMTEIVGTRDGYNGQDKIWRIDNRTIEFGGVPYDQDKKKFQGRPHDLKVFDEATEFLETQVRFLMGWLRSSDPNVRQRVLLTFNPPTTAEGEWVIEFFGPWLDSDHENPAKPGELRWYTTVNGKDQSCEGPEPVEIDGELVEPMSRTFIPAKVEDNPYYMDTGYKRILQALPEPLRSQMLKGDFSAGRKDDAFQVIPSEWVEIAQKRWQPRDDKGDMSSIGVDVARGGEDQTVIARRHGLWWDELLEYPGTETPNGPVVAGLVVSCIRDAAPAHVDGIGVGASVYDHLEGLGVHTVNVISSRRTDKYDNTGMFQFINLRSALWWLFRELLDPKNNNGIALPPGRELKTELCAPRFRIRSGKIQIESKDKKAEFSMWERLGRSPDRADTVIYASISTEKRIDEYDEHEYEDTRSAVSGY
jgi:hypothetical protein